MKKTNNDKRKRSRRIIKSPLQKAPVPAPVVVQKKNSTRNSKKKPLTSQVKAALKKKPPVVGDAKGKAPSTYKALLKHVQQHYGLTEKEAASYLSFVSMLKYH